MRFREFGGYSEYRETNEYRKPTSEEISREMKESADRIQKLLDSIDLSDLEEEKEVNREAIYGIDQEIIRKEEVREIKYDDQKEKNESDTSKKISKSSNNSEKTKDNRPWFLRGKASQKFYAMIIICREQELYYELNEIRDEILRMKNSYAKNRYSKK